MSALETVARRSAHLYSTPNATIGELQRMARTHLSANDLALFEHVTGGSVDSLLHDPAWQRTGRRTMQRLMGINKVVAHQLNARGLHVLRSLLTERITDHMRHTRGSTAHPLYERFMAEGILVFHDVQNISRTLEGLFSANDRQVERLLHMVSGFHALGANSFTEWEEHTHFATDPQFYMHVDTYHPTWKIFVFRQTRLEHGPFHYVYGSHRNGAGKLRWLFNRTRSLTTNRMTANKAVDATGPFADSTHGFHPSLRIVGFEPARNARLPEAGFHRFGFAPPTPVIGGDGMTLVVVDVSGLHFRGWALPGVRRMGSGFAGKGGGCLMCIPRKSPWRCEHLPHDC